MLNFLPSTPKHDKQTKSKILAIQTSPEEPQDKVSLKRLLEEDDEIEIPAIFLTQGAKNSKLLKQNDEIQKQILEDEKRMRDQADELVKVRGRFLKEFNDNGSQYTYSLKHDSELIEKHVQKYYTKDQTLETNRHFFYFSDVEKVEMGVPENEKLAQLVKMTPLFDSKCHSRLLGILSSNEIKMGEFVNYVLEKVPDESTLEMVAGFMEKIEDSGVKLVQDSDDYSLPKYLQILGAKTEPNYSLKLVHYNNNVRVLIYRLCIVFHYILMGDCDMQEVIMQFLLSISDFILNKREKLLLLQKFVFPVFSKIVEKSDPEKLIEVVQTLLALMKVHLYGETEENYWKQQEIAYNALSTLWATFCKKKISAKEEKKNVKVIVQLLLLNYCSFNNPILLTIPDLSEIISRIGTTKYTHQDTYKNLFRAKIAVSLLTNLLYDGKPKIKDDWFHLKQSLLDCKDQLQESIGRILFTKSEELPNKVLLCSILSDTYHTLDQFSMIFEKNLVFLKRDFFYESAM